MKVHATALKHDIGENDILHAVWHPAFIGEPDDELPAKQFILGFDSQGRLLELVILTFDSGNRLVIHAMNARKKYLALLD